MNFGQTFETFYGVCALCPVEIAVEGISVRHGHSGVGKSVFIQVLGQEGLLGVAFKDQITGVSILERKKKVFSSFTALHCHLTWITELIFKNSQLE